MRFSLWRQLRKRLRRSPAWKLASVMILAMTTSLAASAHGNAQEALAPSQSARQSLIETLQTSTAPLNVHLTRIFICGEELSELGELEPNEIIELLLEHPSWTARLGRDGSVLIEERIADLSPACRDHAVFGVDKDGNFSLFDGPPKRNRVLRTFFQLDLGQLESSLPPEEVKRLHKGIPFSDVKEYNSILSSYSDYAMNESKQIHRNYS